MKQQQVVDFGFQRFFFSQIADANGAASDFVLIRGTDSAPRRADFTFAGGFFAHTIQFAVQRQNQSCLIGHFQNIGIDFRSQSGHASDFVAQRPRIDDDAVADDGQLAAHDARRQQGQFIRHAVHDQRVSRVVSALETDDDVGFFAHQIDDFPFAFVAPLRADDYDIGHYRCSCQMKLQRQHFAARKNTVASQPPRRFASVFGFQPANGHISFRAQIRRLRVGNAERNENFFFGYRVFQSV